MFNYLKYILCVCFLGFGFKPNAYAQEIKTVVSLSPAITESIYSLGEQDRLIAVTNYCDYPQEAKSLKKIGTMTHPNIEMIYAMQPDLILASGGLTSKKIVAKLKALGMRVEQFEACESFADIEGNYINLAKILNVENKAKRVMAEVKAELAKIRKVFDYDTREKVVWQVGAKPLVVTGALSFTNEYIAICGAENIFSDLNALYPRVSREEVFVRNPDRIFIITMGIATEVELDAWNNFKELKAVKNSQVHVIDANKVCRATPEGFLSGVVEVAKFMKKVESSVAK